MLESTTVPLTAQRSPLTILFPFTDFRNLWPMANGQCMVNGKQKTVNEGAGGAV